MIVGATKASVVDIGVGVWTWSPLTNGDSGTAVPLLTNANVLMVQLTSGTLGVGGTCVWEGSIDNGATYWPLTDGNSAISMTALLATKMISERPLWVRPRVTAGDGTTSLLATLVSRTGGGGGGATVGGGAATVADGADVNAGSTTDIAATVDSIGTMSAKLRLITKQLDNIYTLINSANAVAVSTLANVNASVTSVTLLASNANRLGATIVNDSVSATLYVKEGATASATSYTHALAPGGELSLDRDPIYTGIIDGIWTAAVGAARVTSY